MADIVVSSKKKVNLFDRVIQSVVIMVNMNKMNRAIDEHLNVVHKAESEDKRIYEENILREIVFVKYQYDIMQRQMYELKISYNSEIIDKINSTDKIDRLELQKIFLEMEYDRITKAKFRSREDVKFNLLAISSAIDAVKQNIKDEGKSQRYNKIIKNSEDIDTKIQTEEYTEDLYKELFDSVDEYVSYINDNYDISKLPTDERELIEYVIESMIKGIESDIDKHLYEYNLIINICKNSYRYFKIIDKIFVKLQTIYDESLEKDIISLADYIKMFKEIYDLKIKTMVNDVHRTIKTEDEYLEYSKIAAGESDEDLEKFVLQRAYETTQSEEVKKILDKKLKPVVEEIETSIEEKSNVQDLDVDTISKRLEELVLSRKKIELEQEKNKKSDDQEVEVKKERKARIGVTKTLRKVGRPRKNPVVEVTEKKSTRGRKRKVETSN